MIPKEPELTADNKVWLFGEDWAEQMEEPRYMRETVAKGNIWNKEIGMCRFLIEPPLSINKGMEEKWGHAGNQDRLRVAKVYGHCRRPLAFVTDVHMQGQSWGPQHISQHLANQPCRKVSAKEGFIRLEFWLRWTKANTGQRPTDLFPWRTFPVAGAAAAYLHTCRLCFCVRSTPWAQWGRPAPWHTWFRWSSSAQKSRLADFPHLGKREKKSAQPSTFHMREYLNTIKSPLGSIPMKILIWAWTSVVLTPVLPFSHNTQPLQNEH